jgi:hypothetical protein
MLGRNQLQQVFIDVVRNKITRRWAKRGGNRISPGCRPSSLGSFCQKSRPRLYLTETTAADFHSPQHFWPALPKTERYKLRLILPARIRAETGYGDGVAPQLPPGHEPEERLP